MRGPFGRSVLCVRSSSFEQLVLVARLSLAPRTSIRHRSPANTPLDLVPASPAHDLHPSVPPASTMHRHFPADMESPISRALPPSPEQYNRLVIPMSACVLMELARLEQRSISLRIPAFAIRDQQ